MLFGMAVLVAFSAYRVVVRLPHFLHSVMHCHRQQEAVGAGTVATHGGDRAEYVGRNGPVSFATDVARKLLGWAIEHKSGIFRLADAVGHFPLEPVKRLSNVCEYLTSLGILKLDGTGHRCNFVVSIRRLVDFLFIDHDHCKASMVSPPAPSAEEPCHFIRESFSPLFTPPETAAEYEKPSYRLAVEAPKAEKARKKRSRQRRIAEAPPDHPVVSASQLSAPEWVAPTLSQSVPGLFVVRVPMIVSRQIGKPLDRPIPESPDSPCSPDPPSPTALTLAEGSRTSTGNRREGAPSCLQSLSPPPSALMPSSHTSLLAGRGLLSRLPGCRVINSAVNQYKAVHERVSAFVRRSVEEALPSPVAEDELVKKAVAAFDGSHSCEFVEDVLQSLAASGSICRADGLVMKGE